MNENRFGNAMEDMIRKSLDNQAPGDFIDGEGLRCCGVCGQRKEYILPAGPRKGEKVGTNCECVNKELAAREAAIKQQRIQNQIEELRRNGLTSEAYQEYTFANDTGINPQLMEFCRFYVDTWDERKKNGEGILLYGSHGAGKSFAAGCIVNALIDEHQETAFITSLIALKDNHQKKPQEFLETMDRIKNSALVVLDDLGSEDSSAKDLAVYFRIINERSLVKKPTIFTTNLDIQKIENETDDAKKRIYDRVLGMGCAPIKVIGASIRRENAKKSAADMRKSFTNWKKQQNLTP